MTEENKQPFSAEEGRSDQPLGQLQRNADVNQSDQREVGNQSSQPSLQSQNRLDQQVQENPTRKGLAILSLSCFLAALLVCGLLGFFMGKAAPETVQPPEIKSAAKDQVSSRDSIADAYLDMDKASFSWAVDDFKKLRFSENDSLNGLTAEKVIADHGKASALKQENSDLELHWNDLVYKEDYDGSSSLDLTVPQLRLSFKEDEQGTYRLDHLYGSYLNFSGSLHGKDVDMTTAYFSGLKIGDSKTGSGGISYAEVLKEYGAPYGFNISRALSSEGGQVQMEISYALDDDKTCKLIFIQQADGDYLLASAERNS